jgi:type III secretory pathway component EscU
MIIQRKKRIKENKQTKDKTPSNYKAKGGIKPKEEEMKEIMASHDLRSRLRQSKLVPQQHTNVCFIAINTNI